MSNRANLLRVCPLVGSSLSLSVREAAMAAAAAFTTAAVANGL